MMLGPRFSPIDVPWLDPDPDAPCCQCPDAFRENGIAVEYCPQHGEKPDFSLCHDPKGARRYRVEQGLLVADP